MMRMYSIGIWFFCRATLSLMVAAAFVAAVGAGVAGANQPAIEPEIKITVGAFASKDSPWDLDWQRFKHNAETRSNHRVAVKLLTRGETGGEPNTMSTIRRNRIQFGGFTIGGASAIVPELSVLLAPFFFQDQAELDYVMDEHMLEIFRPLFAEKNLYLIQWVEVGWLNFYGRRPILRPEDAKGYSLRSQASEASQVLMKSLGGDIIQVPFSDLIPALQTGLIDGGETNMLIYSLTGVDKEAPHLTITQHSYDTGVVVANHEWFKGLSKEDQTLIERAFPSSAAARAGVRAMTQQITQKVAADRDVIMHRLSPPERQRWIDATRDNITRVINTVGGRSAQMYQAMLDGRAEYRSRVAPKALSGEKE